ncbi:MAG TPA: chemotaxis-specific protein-glutamate methyltransferase CheB [Solirubrobacterales bacterium]|jgi:two-component system chemotaxis response regulator CheB|nr:chemotaxis-specific protein-glutamate methyltransferase CheB [Solirubrobacterales bacterium]
MSPTRVVIADDSAFMRKLISDVLTRAGMEIAAEVSNGREALEACRKYEPDVLSLDLAMPEVDGMGVLRGLRKNPNIKVVVVSSFTEAEGVRAVDALAEGAFDLVPKFAGRGRLQDFLDELLQKIEAAAEQAIQSGDRPDIPAMSVPRRPNRRPKNLAPGRRLVVIAASTGGPRALTKVLSGMPDQIGLGMLIVQHMPAGFTHSLAARLDAYSDLGVAEASEGDKIIPTRALVAPGGKHLRVRRHAATLTEEPPISGLRPSADITIADAVAEYGSAIVLAVLTGMGRDACKGAGQVRAAGGIVIAERGDTCTVNGMPKAVVDAGYADSVLPIDQIAGAIVEAAQT